MYPQHFFTSLWRPELRDEVFVAMPFHPSFEPRWTRIFRPAIGDVGLQELRIDMNITSSSVPVEIMDAIAHSRLILVDVSAMPDGTRGVGAPNANVMYELGMAQALRDASEVVLFASTAPNLLPFDVAAIRVHFFDHNDCQKARQIIEATLRAALAESYQLRSLQVEKALLVLDHTALALLQRFGTLQRFPVWRKRPADNTYSMSLWDKSQRIAGEIWDDCKQAALQRLIHLGIVRRSEGPQLDPARMGRPDPFLWRDSPKEGSYTWTEFGTAVIRRLQGSH